MSKDKDSKPTGGSRYGGLLAAAKALMANMASFNGDFSRLAWPCGCDLSECPYTMLVKAIVEAEKDNR